MTAGTGEAPSGVLAYESDMLPDEFRGTLLVTSWGDHRIERFHLEPRGASFRATPTAIVKGDENFRPVGIATAVRGNVRFPEARCTGAYGHSAALPRRFRQDAVLAVAELALGRAPKEAERTAAVACIKNSESGLAGLCQALFNVNEFVYRQ